MVNSLRVSMEYPESPFQLADLPIEVNISAVSSIQFVCLISLYFMKWYSGNISALFSVFSI